MAKKSIEIISFHNGLNSKYDSRDIKDDELAVCDNASVDEIGRITMSGEASHLSTITTLANSN